MKRSILKKEIVLLKSLINILEKGYGKKACKEFEYWCTNCRAQVLIGMLRGELEDIKDWLEELK